MNVRYRWTRRVSLKINDTNAAGRLISIKRSVRAQVHGAQRPVPCEDATEVNLPCDRLRTPVTVHTEFFNVQISLYCAGVVQSGVVR